MTDDPETPRKWFDSETLTILLIASIPFWVIGILAALAFMAKQS